MKKLLGITLGIMTALGGFVDFGQIVFTMQAGALFRFRLIWAIMLGAIAIITYMEMCGRVAVVAGEPVFSVVRARFGKHFGLVVLIASNVLNLLTCAAELGGLAILLRLLTGWPERICVVVAAMVIAACIATMSFDGIERTFGLSGLLMIVFGVTAVWLDPDWSAVARGFLPAAANGTGAQISYYYFAVGIFSAMLMEYEVHFYSSGAIEEDWKIRDLPENFAVAALGSLLGTALTVGILIVGAQMFHAERLFPQMLSTAAMAGAIPFGRAALFAAIGGMLACLGGAAIETALSSAYNLCQFYGFPWGQNKRARRVKTFTAAWSGVLVLAAILILSGISPMQLVNFSVIFGMVLMPLTYYPILRVAMDRNVMGKHANHRLVTVLGGMILGLIVVAAVTAIPLMVRASRELP